MSGKGESRAKSKKPDSEKGGKDRKLLESRGQGLGLLNSLSSRHGDDTKEKQREGEGGVGGLSGDVVF